jgi:hypothetical protein
MRKMKVAKRISSAMTSTMTGGSTIWRTSRRRRGGVVVGAVEAVGVAVVAPAVVVLGGSGQYYYTNAASLFCNGKDIESEETRVQDSSVYTCQRVSQLLLDYYCCFMRSGWIIVKTSLSQGDVTLQSMQAPP